MHILYILFALVLAAPASDHALAACDSAQAGNGDGAPTKVLFMTRFNEVPPGLTFDREDIWTVRDGRLEARLPERKQEKSFAFIGSEDWTDYAVELDVKGLDGVDKGIVVRAIGSHGVGVDLRGGRFQDLLMHRGLTRLGQAAVPNDDHAWHHLRIEVMGPLIRVWVDRGLVLEVADSSGERARGRVALAAYTGGAGACHVLYDNLVVTGLGDAERASR